MTKATVETDLIGRDAFTQGVFSRDRHRCVFCSKPAVDAHHLIERKLFKDGGYRLANGISVCSDCHWSCERTDISVEDGRRAAGIVSIILPDGFELNKSYDKWGNEILPSGERLMGPMFDLENVQKAITGHLDLFVG